MKYVLDILLMLLNGMWLFSVWLTKSFDQSQNSVNRMAEKEDGSIKWCWRAINE